MIWRYLGYKRKPSAGFGCGGIRIYRASYIGLFGIDKGLVSIAISRYKI